MGASLVLAAALWLALSGCSEPTGEPDRARLATPDFVNRVWMVSESNSVAAGTLYTFLSDGTLVVASSQGRPSLGRWSYRDGALTMIEEGLAYPVDILELTDDEFRIRMHSPGEPVEM